MRAGVYRGRARRFDGNMPLESLSLLGKSVGADFTSLSVELRHVRQLAHMLAGGSHRITAVDIKMPSDEDPRPESLEQQLLPLTELAPSLHQLRLPALPILLDVFTSLLLSPPPRHSSFGASLRLISVLPRGPPYDYTVYCSPSCTLFEEESQARGIRLELEEAPTISSMELEGGSAQEQGFWRFVERVEKLKEGEAKQDEGLEVARSGMQQLRMW